MNQTAIAECTPAASVAESQVPKQSAITAEPLASVHTNSFPDVLRELQCSLAVTTYQAGKLVFLRNDDGVLNTHFRSLNRPMGMARLNGRLAIGCGIDIWEYHDVPAVCEKLNTSDDYPRVAARHDACFLPRRSHCTGDIQIHEMAWQTPRLGERDTESELIFVNTAFSCLCARSDENSFEPIWRPSFINQLAPGDSCHLNGLAMRDGQPAFVTAFGEQDAPGSWRKNRRDGGLVIDVDSHEVIARGLSMPHSPRWYRDQLWVLESGDGSIGVIDPTNGRYEPIAKFPGFTRGLSFYGPLAFIGLSQVRESAVFSGIPLVDRLEEAQHRSCGVWVLNIETGKTLGFCRFETGVQEIFSVEVMPGVRFPDLVNHDPNIVGHSYVLGDESLQSVPQELRFAAS
ncbi:MAG: TIGR03032 family protein [Planctomycetota bacterium]